MNVQDSFNILGEYSKYISANTGDVYYILINALGPPDTPFLPVYIPLPTKGYKIDFTGSTCTFVTGNPVQIDSIGLQCTNYKYITLYLSKYVVCNSIEALGSDFDIPNGSPFITTGIGCSSGTTMTKQIKIQLAPNLQPGTYTINSKIGTDGNTLVDMCGDQMPVNSAATFIVPKLDSNVNVTLCPQQFPYHWNNQIITAPGNNIATYITQNYFGCDSLSTLSVTLVDTIKDTSNIFICPSQLPYIWNGITVNTVGTNVAYFHSIASTGCDSLTILSLTSISPQNQQTQLTGCGSLFFEGNNYTQSTIINDTLHSNFGCDSLYRNISIVIFPTMTPIVLNIDTISCGFIYFRDKVYTQNTTITDTIRNQYNCDSVYLNYNIQVYPNVQPQLIEYTVSDCNKVNFENNIYTSDTTYAVLFKNRSGCDSIIRNTHIVVKSLDLELLSDPEQPVKGDHVRLSTKADVPYSIIAWSPYSLFPNQNRDNQIFVIEQKDTFKVIGKSEDGCIDTAILYLNADSLIPVSLMPNAFSPNGDGLNDEFSPFFVSKSGYIIKRFKIFDRWGKLVYEAFNARNAAWNGTYGNSGKNADVGTYYYYIDIEFIDQSKKSYKGSVILIR